jgi:hypothetical protein
MNRTMKTQGKLEDSESRIEDERDLIHEDLLHTFGE